MRIGCALFGVLVIPFGYMIVYEKTRSTSASLLAAAFLAFDNGLTVLSRFILLDPILLCFIFGAVLGDAKFRNVRKAFSSSWWGWLFFTGFMLGLGISTKYVGLFVFCYVGLSTVERLWELLASSSPTTFVAHFLARFVALLVVPAAIYLASFVLHFAILTKAGTGSIFLAPQFQVHYEGSPFVGEVVPKYVSYYSNISLRGLDMGCGFLHSHPVNYPTGVGARQQMVTSYQHEDPNNFFAIKPWDGNINVTSSQFIRHGDLVRIEHLSTGRNVHSHNHPAVMKNQHYQVTGYGWQGQGDANDVWRIEVQGGKIGDRLETYTSHISFRHYFLNCLLSCSGSPLPKWGFDQGEISCAKWRINMAQSAPHGCSFWRVYRNNGTIASRQVDNEEPEMIKVEDISASFWARFIDAHKLMFNINGKLGKKHDGTMSEERNDPHIWPLNSYAQVFTGGYDRDRPMVYMLGNPLIWWINLAVIISLPLSIPAILIFSDKQGCDGQVTGWLWMMLGWALHYLPFFMMNRALYQHHYYPSSVFISMGSSILIWRYSERFLSPTLRRLVVGATVLGAFSMYLLFSPLVYGMIGEKAVWSNSSYHYLHWHSKWGF